MTRIGIEEGGPVNETTIATVRWVGSPGDITKNAINVGQLSADELLPQGAVQLTVVRTRRVRDRTAPVRMTDAWVTGWYW